MNKLAFIFFLISFVFSSQAQIDPQFTFFNFNSIYNNPANAGLDNKISTLFIHRSQWLGYQPSVGSGIAPTTQVLSFGAPVKLLGGGLGFYMTNDALANVLRNNNVMLSYSFHQKINNQTKLGLGLKAGVYNSRIDGSVYRFNDQGDPNISTGTDNALTPDLGLGVAIYNPKYNFGLSSSHINSAKLRFADSDGYTIPMFLVLNGGYFFDLGSKFVINPNFIVKTTSKVNQLSFDVGSFVEYDSRFWFGSTFRSFESLNFMAGVNVLRDNNLKIGYAFDFVVSNRSAKALSSHEIVLLYTLEPLLASVKPPVRSPRFRF